MFNSDIKVREAIFLLHKLSSSWERRAQVRNPYSNHLLSFDSDADDFLIELLPFKNHPLFEKSSIEMKKKILSCGWMIYTKKTIDIETKILHAACTEILLNDLPGTKEPVIKKNITETLIDESYHTLLSKQAIQQTELYRDIRLNLPPSSLITNMQQAQEQHQDTWKKELILIASAIISEIHISDYLGLLSNARHIQPMNQFSVAIHRKDELAHASIFKHLAILIYTALNRKQKEFFSSILTHPAKWFNEHDWTAWQSALMHLSFVSANEMINDCKMEYTTKPDAIHIELKALVQELNIKQD